MPVGILFKWVLYRTALVAGYLEVKLKKEQVASNECVYRENVFMRLSTNFVSPLPPRPTRQLKLGGACSSDVYTIPRTKSEVIFTDSLCRSCEPLIVMHILVCAPNSST